MDGVAANPHAVDFACYLARLTNSKVTGIFLENLIANQKVIVGETYGHKYLEWTIDKDSDEYREKMEEVEKNERLFKDACDKRAARYSIHRKGGEPSKEVIRESRYADVLVINAETSFNREYEGVPTEFVKEVLKGSECPVIIAPESFERIDEIVFTWNASMSSMFAIKQFCYLFPQLEDKKVKVLQVQNDGYETDREEFEIFKEWLSSHYSSVVFEILKGDAETELFANLYEKKNIIVVIGAYGRSTVSQFFKHSHANLLVKTLSQAIFIAHC